MTRLFARPGADGSFDTAPVVTVTRTFTDQWLWAWEHPKKGQQWVIRRFLPRPWDGWEELERVAMDVEGAA